MRFLLRGVAALVVAVVASADASAMYVVNASGGLNVRTGPGTNYSVIRTLANGTQVTVVQNSGDWRKISFVALKKLPRRPALLRVVF